jgi:hypothetical protein
MKRTSQLKPTPTGEGSPASRRTHANNAMKTNKARIVTSWILQIIAAAILAQTLFFKFSGAEESKYISVPTK